MTTAESVEDQTNDALGDGHGHDDHDHHEHPDGPFIAHHFDSAEQQFDSGKLGMWLFLVQEVLFFSGLFVAYIIYRNHNPEIFEAAHVHLDKWLGGLNTLILLFSSLTMALAVRCSQLEQHFAAAVNIVITMVCANIFLGVKAIEYSHKWELGLWWASAYSYGQPQGDLPPYLLYLSIPFIILTLGSTLLAIYCRVTASEFWFKFFLGMAISFGGYFVGLGIAWAVPTAEHDSHGGHAAHGSEHPGEKHKHADGESHDGESKDGESKDGESKDGKHAAGEQHDGKSEDTEQDSGEKGKVDESESTETPASDEMAADEMEEVNLGGFFSIYYIMTGLHAIHIIAGVAALSWLFYRVLAMHFRRNYFGPVENVGLYWHLVDLIWIYLFPMMYLIH